jgi:hypothetical protein
MKALVRWHVLRPKDPIIKGKERAIVPSPMLNRAGMVMVVIDIIGQNMPQGRWE